MRLHEPRRADAKASRRVGVDAAIRDTIKKKEEKTADRAAAAEHFLQDDALHKHFDPAGAFKPLYRAMGTIRK